MKAALGKEPIVLLDVRRNRLRLGSEYGGWEIIANGLDAQSVVYSFGVGEDASFDIALIERFGLSVHAFDPTPKSIDWVKRQGFPSQFVLHEYGVGASDGEVNFYPPEDASHVSYTMLERASTKSAVTTVPVKRLKTIMAELGHTRIDLLKMDIEGAEYEVIADLRDSDIRPAQLLVEFHHRFPGVGARRTLKAVKDLRAIGYRVFFIASSNDEFGFVHEPASI